MFTLISKKRFLSLPLSFILSLFLLSNGLAEESPRETPDAPPVKKNVGYKKGFFIQSSDGRYYLNIGGYIQPLYLAEILEGEDNEETFRVRRARLKFKGHLYSERIKYQLEYDFAKTALLSTFLQLEATEWFKLRAGQMKIPFNFEALSSASTLQFVDRSLTDSLFGFKDQREPGAALRGNVADDKFEYIVGLFNGEGLGEVNQNFDIMIAGRFVYNIMGKHGYAFGDTKQSEQAKVAFGLGAYYNDTPEPDAGAYEIKQTSLTADLSAKYKGFSGHGAYYFRNSNPDVSQSTNDNGFLAQIGYFPIPKKLEIAFRTDQYFSGVENNQQEYSFATNYYIYGSHRVKLQADYAAILENDGVAVGDNSLDHRIRVQLQLKI